MYGLYKSAKLGIRPEEKSIAAILSSGKPRNPNKLNGLDSFDPIGAN